MHQSQYLFSTFLLMPFILFCCPKCRIYFLWPQKNNTYYDHHNKYLSMSHFSPDKRLRSVKQDAKTSKSSHYDPNQHAKQRGVQICSKTYQEDQVGQVQRNQGSRNDGTYHQTDGNKIKQVLRKYDQGKSLIKKTKNQERGIFSSIKQCFSGKDKQDYQTIYAGLSFQTTCQYSRCEAYNQTIFVNKGFNSFNIGKQIFLCVCPWCGFKTPTAKKLCFLKTHIEVETKYEYQAESEAWAKTIMQPRFWDLEQVNINLGHINFLQITTKPIRRSQL